MKKKRTAPLPRMPRHDAWAKSWQKHSSKVGLPGSELPIGGPCGEESEFLTHVRTPANDRAWLKGINDEFVRGFKGLKHAGPAVTVFGSARFKETHPCYNLARATGAELAKAGFATLTGGGPGIMEAVDIIVRGLPTAVRKRLKPPCESARRRCSRNPSSRGC